MKRKTATKPKGKVVKRQSADSNNGTTYDPSLCKRVMDLGRNGKSPAQIRSALKILNSQWASWIRHYPDFKEAVDESYFLAMAFWEDAGMVGMQMGVPRLKPSRLSRWSASMSAGAHPMRSGSLLPLSPNHLLGTRQDSVDSY